MRQGAENSQKEANLLGTSAAALLILFGSQLVVGLALGLQYSPTIEGAYASVAGLPPLLRAFHYWGSAWLIVHSGLHLAAMTWCGWYRPPHTWRYLACIVLVICAMGFQLSGNVLPMDRHGVQTAVVEVGVARQVPVVGEFAARTMLQGEAFGQATLSAWWWKHVGLTILLILGSAGAFVTHFRLRDAQEDRRFVLVPIAVCLIASVMFGAPIGQPATPEDFTRFDAAPSWYVLPMHGALVLANRAFGAPWVGSAVFPALVVGFFGLLLLLGNRASLRFARGGLGLVAATMVGATLGAGTGPAGLVGNRDPSVVEPIRTVPERSVSTQDAILAERGRALFHKTGCDGCHGKDGIAPKFGPSLADSHQRHPDAEFYVKFIANPQSVRTGSTMPAYPQLTQQELRELAEFLRFPIRRQ